MKRIDEILYSLNSLARTGWMLSGVEPCKAESVSMHSFASAIMALSLSSYIEGIDPYKATSIALIHDLGESVIGDIAKSSNVKKNSAELEAFEKLDIDALIKDLYKEYRNLSSKEAIVAKIADLIATYIIAKKYKKEGYDVGEIEASTLKELRKMIELNKLEKNVNDFLLAIGVKL